MKRGNRTTSAHSITRPDSLKSYFKKEKHSLILVTISGILYNAGLLAGPYYQGKLLDDLNTNQNVSTVLTTAAVFLCFILAVQVFRYIKRFYVRRFANNTLKSMRTALFHSILSKHLSELEKENTGSLMAKATGDVDACVEGMRKFTTELFDTGIFMVSYLIMMLTYDVKLTFITSFFIALALIVAQLLKGPIYSLTSAWRKSAGELNGLTYELTDSAMLYRTYGRDEANAKSYQALLLKYKKKAVKATVAENAMEPVYSAIVMGASLFIIIFGARMVSSSIWTVGTFSAYLTLFAGLAEKASHAGKLFNSVQKASVSWKRIRPYLAAQGNDSHNQVFSTTFDKAASLLSLKAVSFSFENKKNLFSNVSFELQPGMIIGITGPVACGKSVLAHVFLGSEGPQSYEGASLTGTILFKGMPLSSLSSEQCSDCFSYMFHNSALFSGTIYDNITLGKDGDIAPVLHAVSFDTDLMDMPEGIQTIVGNGGIRLSGGQQSRLALARALYHHASVLILDDPFAAVDPSTEKEIIDSIRTMQTNGPCNSGTPFAVLLFSHRLSYFNKVDAVMVMKDDGSMPDFGTHDSLLHTSQVYRTLCAEQNIEGVK